MIIDASAIVAILTEEPMSADIIAALEGNRGPVAVSPLSVFEAALGLARKRSLPDRPSTPGDIENALGAVENFLGEIDAEEVPVSAEFARAAIAAAARFGRAVGHPARLNFGDCFSYALAKARGEPLLFIGADFTETDAASVLADPRPRR